MGDRLTPEALAELEAAARTLLRLGWPVRGAEILMDGGLMRVDFTGVTVDTADHFLALLDELSPDVVLAMCEELERLRARLANLAAIERLGWEAIVQRNAVEEAAKAFYVKAGHVVDEQTTRADAAEERARRLEAMLRRAEERLETAAEAAALDGWRRF